MAKGTGWTGRLGKLLGGHREPGKAPQEADPGSPGLPTDDEEGRKYLERVRSKLAQLVEDFTEGRVNRAQFEALYTHYQNERRTIETLIAAQPSSHAWRLAATEGQSINIRRRQATRVLGYAVYCRRSENALRVYGEFVTLHERWISPLLHRVSEATNKLFVVSSFGTTSEEAPCLCAVAGEFTTLLVLFTTEPARVQMQSLEDLHSHFEQANQRVLERSTRSAQPIDPDQLVFPFAAAFE